MHEWARSRHVGHGMLCHRHAILGKTGVRGIILANCRSAKLSAAIFFFRAILAGFSSLSCDCPPLPLLKVALLNNHCLRFLAGILAALLMVMATACGSPRTVSHPTAVDTPQLCARIDAVLKHVRDGRRLNASVHGAWQVVHGILAFGQDFPIEHGSQVSGALDYLLGGGTLNGWALRPGKPGVIAVVDHGSTTGQGHPDQWLGYLSQCGSHGIPIDTPLRVGGRDYTVADLLSQAQFDIQPGQEATWTLMALSAYLPADATWQARDGSTWTTERVVQMEADADLFSSPCGGAHRLYGLVSAVNKHTDAQGEAVGQTPSDLSGGWAAAADTIQDAIDRAQRFQQADGSFSIHSFERSGTSADIFAKLGATGHVFEVLVLALDDQRLAEPWMAHAADRLVTMLEQTADVDVECGALYHAAHGLLLYRQRLCDRSTTASVNDCDEKIQLPVGNGPSDSGSDRT